MGFEALQRLDAISGWEAIGTDEHDSTVATFVGGARCVVPTKQETRDDIVHIWQGVHELVEPEDGEPYETFYFEGYDEDEVPDDAMYVVQFHPENKDGINSEVVTLGSAFAANYGEAIDIAQNFIEQRKDGSLN